MTRIVAFADTVDEDSNIEEVRLRITRVNELFKEFNDVEDKMFALDDILQSDLEEFENKYYHALSIFNAFMRDANLRDQNTMVDDSAANGSRIVNSDFKLPRCQIPPFDGNYKDWQSFFDLFNSTIHENMSLSAAHKFQYLKSLLRADAANLVKHFAITEANYIEAFQKLCKRYNRKKHIITSFLQTFMDQPAIKQVNANNVRRLSDTTDEVIRGLKALGPQAETRDPWLIYIILNKLDDESKQLWAQEVAEEDFPSVEMLLNFLNKRSNTMEEVRINKPTPQRPTMSRPPAMVKTLHIGTVISCPLCSDNHKLYECKKFCEMNIIGRRDFVKDGKRCFNCLSNTHLSFRCRINRRCQSCNKKHHNLLHLDEEPNSAVIVSTPSTSTGSNETSISNLAAMIAKPLIINNSLKIPIGLLPTAVVNIIDSSGEYQCCRVLLDTGSQLSFITEACVQRLRLPRVHSKIHIKGVGSVYAGVTRGATHIKLHSRYDNSQFIESWALILSTVTSQLPSVEFPVPECYNLEGLELADQKFNIPGQIDILLGINQFLKILMSGQVVNNLKEPIAQQTIFGYVIAGEVSSDTEPNHASYHSSFVEEKEVDIDLALRQFWEIENIPTKKLFTEEEENCEKHFEKTVRRLENGRFVVKLPFKDIKLNLGDSQYLASKRLSSMLKRFDRDELFHSNYVEFMKEYADLHHMELISSDDINKYDHNVFYLPHHGVLKETSSTTKLRVVFDASARSSSGHSLNDYLMVGPTVQQPLITIIQRFRMHKFAFTSDVEKMYRQVLVDRNDTDFQRIVWQETSDAEKQHFRLLTVTYGTASAPYLATKVLAKLGEDNKEEFPRASSIIKNDFYVDDLISGADTEEEAKLMVTQVKNILASAGFKLRKWASNYDAIVKIFPEKDREIKGISMSINSNLKILGLKWYPVNDIFKFHVNLAPNPTLTKRGILSEASKLFDPLGWLAPTVVKFKIFLQKLWLLKLGWDDQLDREIAGEWMSIRDDLHCIEQIELQRWLQNEDVSFELHGFADASEDAYAAVVYCRAAQHDGTIAVNIIAAKTKVAPIKQLSIPRLELCAASLLTKLITSVKESLANEKIKIFCWSDSTIVLSWLASHPRRWKTFVANRTAEILTTTSSSQWRHIPSEQNPADCASRGIMPNELVNHPLWWHGPEWLQNDQKNWPLQIEVEDSELELKENKDKQLLEVFNATIQLSVLQTLVNNISKFSTIIRVVCWVNRFVQITRKQNIKRSNLTSMELQYSTQQIIRWIQLEDFSQEIHDLNLGKSVKGTSRLKSLDPFVDKFNILRVGGRIQNSNVPYETKHPAIISSTNIITQKIVEEHHFKYLHAGPSLLINILKQKYWILGCRNLVKKITHNCVICTRYRQSSASQIMGNLPEDRVTFTRPFLKTGVDYAGPVSLKLIKGRGQKLYKGYICIFVCMSTKAVHIELVSDLSTDQFIAAFRRFTSRRGLCTDMYSDNGTNFVGANRNLKELNNFLKQNNNIISNSLLSQNINWHFIPPAASHFGGLWESAVKSTKYHLRRILGNQILTYEELMTLLTQIEAILNSRPICKGAGDDIDALTPSHFLIGHPSVLIPEPELLHLNLSKLSRWQMIQQMMQHFWLRWHREYLTALQQRHKWQTKNENIKLDDVTLIKDECLPPSKWLYGRVIQLHPGDDNIVRVVTLKTQGGILKRPIHKLVILPIN